MKGVGSMEIIVFCITLSLVMAVLLVGIGVTIGRCDKGELDGDNDIKLYVRNRNRDRSSVGRYSAEEMIFVLNNIKRLTRGWEREILEGIIDYIQEKKGEDDDGK